MPQFKEIKYFDMKKLIEKETIDEGGFSCVFSMIDIENDEELAVKKYRLDIYNHTVNERIMNNIKIEMCIDNPSFIKFIGFSFDDSDENARYIIMEKASNDQLSDFIKDTELTDIMNQIILIGIANGIKHLHEINIIHCDISKSNILFDDDLHPKICGFSLSIMNQMNLYRNNVAGTHNISLS